MELEGDYYLVLYSGPNVHADLQLAYASSRVKSFNVSRRASTRGTVTDTHILDSNLIALDTRPLINQHARYVILRHVGVSRRGRLKEPSSDLSRSCGETSLARASHMIRDLRTRCNRPRIAIICEVLSTREERQASTPSSHFLDKWLMPVYH